MEERAVCLPCGFELDKPDRIAQVLHLLEHEEEPLVLLTHLLRWCRDEHDILWEEGHDGARQVAFGDLGEVRAAAAAGQTAVGRRLRRAMAQVLEDSHAMPPVVVARSLAVLLDECFWPTFRNSFARRSPYQPGVGDPIPLDSPDFRDLTDMTPTSPPWRLANRLDETRHVRLAGEWAVQFRVVFDYSASDAVAGLISADTVVATCHPNQTVSELGLSASQPAPLFPVIPSDPQRQAEVINQLIAAACDAGASIVVLPELATTERIAADLESWVRRGSGLNLVVAGSYHHDVADENGPVRRANTALAWLRGHAQPLTHDKHSPGDRPSAEGIQPQGWPELRVYVGADGFHLVIAICRDLLNPSAVHALSEVGANLVLVPAMSETLTPFVGSVANLVTSSQALVAVANNPAQWPRNGDTRSVSRPARALFGHPGLGHLTRLVEPGDSSPGIATMRVSSGQLTWLPAPPHGERRGGLPGHPVRPDWMTRLATAACLPGEDANVTVTGAGPRAAVLVLLSDQDGVPCVLLTGRAPGLSRFPGRVVFPGGLVEPTDPNVAAAAIREAHEETGLSPSRLEILGVMSPMALPEDDMTVYPVLGWHDQNGSAPWSVNYAEVDSIAEVPLRLLASEHAGQATNLTSWLGTDPALPAELGDMTRAVLDHLIGAALRTGVLERDLRPSGFIES